METVQHSKGYQHQRSNYEMGEFAPLEKQNNARGTP